MKIILLISKNSEKTNRTSKYKTQNLDLVVVGKEKYIKHYLEEYIPGCIIVNNPLKILYEITNYSVKNPRTTIFLCNLNKYIKQSNPNFVFNQNSNLKKNIIEIITAIITNKSYSDLLIRPIELIKEFYNFIIIDLPNNFHGLSFQSQ